MKDIDSIIGVDPGGTTGIATIVAGRWSAFQIPSPADVIPYLEGFVTTLRARQPERGIQIASERYINAPGRGARTTQDDAMKINNDIVRMACRLDPRAEWLVVTMQAAGDAKKCAPSGFLHFLRCHKPAMPHADDATRHAILRLHNRYPAAFLTLDRGEFALMNMPIEDEVSGGVR